MGNKPLHLAHALKQYYYYARELIQLLYCLLRVSNSYIAFNEMQEVFIDHQASHIPLQMQNFSSLSPRAGASIGSAPSWPGWPFLASSRGGQPSRLFGVQLYSGETDTFRGRQVAHPSSSNPEYPFPASTPISTILVTTLTALHGALWALMKPSRTQKSSSGCSVWNRS